MANNLRRVSALQTDFGVFTSLKTLQQPRGGRACWNMMKAGLVALEEYLHGDRADRHRGWVGGAGKGKGKGRPAAPAPRGAKKSGGGAEGARESAVRVLPRLLHR